MLHFRDWISHQTEYKNEEMAIMVHQMWMSWARAVLDRHGDELPKELKDRWESFMVPLKNSQKNMIEIKTGNMLKRYCLL